MGHQFTFVGNQFKVAVDDKEYFIDLLLYRRQLQCLVAIELKIGEFLPEYKGKMEFYLTLLNEKVKLPNEKDSIGIIICKAKNRTVVEYSLKTSNQPIGVATYSTSTLLPKDYQKLLPDEKIHFRKVEQVFSIAHTFGGTFAFFCKWLAEQAGKYYKVGWEPKSKKHWTTNPFDK